MLKLALAVRRHGWLRLGDFLLELDCRLSGLGGASRRIKRARDARQKKSKKVVLLEWGEQPPFTKGSGWPL